MTYFDAETLDKPKMEESIAKLNEIQRRLKTKPQKTPPENRNARFKI